MPNLSLDYMIHFVINYLLAVTESFKSLDRPTLLKETHSQAEPWMKTVPVNFVENRDSFQSKL